MMGRIKCKYEGTGAWEGRCVGTKEVDPCIGIEKCDRYKPDCLTHADRIRAMSDEELAETIGDFGLCAHIQEHEKQWCDAMPDDCGNCIIEWLKQPVKDGGDK